MHGFTSILRGRRWDYNIIFVHFSFSLDDNEWRKKIRHADTHPGKETAVVQVPSAFVVLHTMTSMKANISFGKGRCRCSLYKRPAFFLSLNLNQITTKLAGNNADY